MRHTILAVLLATVTLSSPSRADGPADAANGQSAETTAALKERDRLSAESAKLQAAGKTAEAIAAAEAMLAIERKHLGNDDPEVAGSLDRLAELQAEREDFAAAKASRREALAILRKKLGDDHWQVGDARRALEDQERVAGMEPDRRRRLAEATRLQTQMYALYDTGKFHEALPLAKQVLAITKEALGERHPDHANNLNNLAALLQAQGDYAAARPLCERAVAITKEALGERHPEYATSLDNLATLLQWQGDYAAARPLCERAVAIRKEVLGERHSDYAISLNHLATLLQWQGDYAAARPLCERAVAITKEALGERHPDYANSLNNLARLLQWQGDHAAARPLCERALAIQKGVLGERHPDYAASLNNLALLLQSQGDHAAARPLCERALAIRKEALGERHPDYAQSLNNLARLLQWQGDHAAARPLCERALAIRKEVLGERHPDYAISLNNLALLLQSQGQHAAARPLSERAVAITKEALGERHPDYAQNLNNLATLLQWQGEYAAARPLCERALAIRKEVLGERHPDYAQSLSNLAALEFSQRDYAGAAPLQEKVVGILERNLDLAAAALSERQQMAMARTLRGDLDLYLSLAPRSKVPAWRAYNHVLVVKGAVFERQRHLNALRRLSQAGPDPGNARLFTQLTEATNRLTTLALVVPGPGQADAWRAEVAERTKRKEDLEVELARKDAGFRAARAEERRTSEEIRAALPRESALVDLLEYTHYDPPAGGKGRLVYETRLFAFVVRRDRPVEMIDLGPHRPITEAVESWRSQLKRRNAAQEGPARDVRKLVWEPLETHLEGAATVLVSPDRALGRVPLAALPGKAEGSYLIEERTIVTIPVPRMLGSTAEATEAPPSLLLVGDVAYGGEPGASDARGESRSAATRAGMFGAFPALKGTRDEVEAIAGDYERRHPGIKPTRLDGLKATEEAVRKEAPKHRFLHLATHGYFAPPGLRSALAPDPDARSRSGIDPLGGQGVIGFHPGLLSGIALAGANRRPAPPGEDDGILTALEVAGLDLSGCELAVVSACETGMGLSAGGEELLGLQRAFQVAGARNVVASLWKVDDEKTRDLMARFYENLWREGLAPSAALRKAQLAMLRENGPDGDRTPPFEWAAFVLSSDRP